MDFKNKFRNNFFVFCGAETKDLILEDQEGCIGECEAFDYLGVKRDKEDRQEKANKNRINKDRGIREMLNDVMGNRQISRKNNLK